MEPRGAKIESDDQANPEELNPENLEKDPVFQSIISLQDQEEFIKQIKSLKSEGNSLFKSEEFDQAVTIFTKAIQIIDHKYSEETLLENPPVFALALSLYNNRALANSKLDLNYEAISDSKIVLKLDPDNKKALFRIAKCQAIRNNFEAAKQNLSHLLSIEPTNEAALKELKEIEEIINKTEDIHILEHKKTNKTVEFVDDDKSFHRKVSFRDEEGHSARSSSRDYKKADSVFPGHRSSEEDIHITPDALFISTCKSLKHDPLSFYSFLKKTPFSDIQTFFAGHRFPVSLLNECVEAISISDFDHEWVIGFFTAIKSTHHFLHTIDNLSSNEKNNLFSLIEKLGSDELRNSYIVL